MSKTPKGDGAIEDVLIDDRHKLTFRTAIVHCQLDPPDVQTLADRYQEPDLRQSACFPSSNCRKLGLFQHHAGTILAVYLTKSGIS